MAVRIATVTKRRGDTITVVTGALAALAIVWFVLNLAGPWGWSGLGWLPGPLAMVPGTVAFWRLGALPTLMPAARRFWRQIGVGSGVVVVASVIQSFAVMTGLAPSAAPADTPVATLALFFVAILIALWALLRLPVGASSRARWLHLVLDGATVMAGAVVFTWYFAIAPIVTGEPGAPVVWGLLGVGVFVQVALAAAVKVLLAGTGPVDAGALRVLSLTLMVGALGTGLTPLRKIIHSSLSTPARTRWAWLVVLAPLLGIVLWFLAGRPAAARQRPSTDQA